MLHAGGDDKILRLFLLHNQPHALHIILRIAPVTQGIHISKLQMILQSFRDPARRQGDFSGDEIFTAALGLMVEQNAVYRKHTIGLPVLLRDPEAVLLRHRVRAVGMKRRGLFLGNLLHLAVQLGGGRLINLRFLYQSEQTDRFQHTQNADCVHFSGILRHIEGNLHMALRGQIINFIRLHQADDADHGRGIRQISVMQRDPVQDVLDTPRIGAGSPAGDAMHLIALLQKELRQIGTVLSGDTRYQCHFLRILTHYP